MLRSWSSPLEAPLEPPPGFEEIQRDELSRLFGRMAGIRLFALPLALALMLLVAFTEPAPWRKALVLGLCLPASAFFVSEAVRHRRRGLTPLAVPANLLVVLLVQLGLAFATGALESPVTYAFVPLAVMVGVFASRQAHLAVVAAQLLGVLALLLAELLHPLADLNPLAFGGGARSGHGDVHLVTTAVVLAVVLALASRAGRGVRRTFDAMLAQALRAQRESVRAHAERTEELTALSAEIAHELKNPLASVKGLSALLAEGASGKAAERLAVLRREVDRMQGILGEFLNFSRPLVPLEAGRVDLGRLALDVGQLHEGMAHERGVGLEVRTAPALAECDARKVKQVLMNLVQNALDASPGGTAIEIEVGESAGGEATVRVLDRGGGLDPALAERAFEPGVTTKPRGSGLGLTIARALARQHGGEVELRAREGGGSVAVLRLPAAAPGGKGGP